MPDPISWEFSWPYLAAALLFGYLLGSIPFGLILTRAAGLGDIRAIGSGNIGATNVLRTGNRRLAAATLVLDGLKGTLAVLGAAEFGPDTAVTAAFGALAGHLFPVWLRFRGGKGVATALGIWFALAFPVALACCATWAAMAALFRISSLAALTAFALSPVFATLFADPQRTEAAIIIAAVVILAHHANIGRLLRGKEPRIGAGKGTSTVVTSQAQPTASQPPSAAGDG